MGLKTTRRGWCKFSNIPLHREASEHRCERETRGSIPGRPCMFGKQDNIIRIERSVMCRSQDFPLAFTACLNCLFDTPRHTR